MYDKASEMYNVYLETYFDQYILFQIMRKERWVLNMIILINFLKHITMLAALKIKSRLIQQGEVIEKN